MGWFAGAADRGAPVLLLGATAGRSFFFLRRNIVVICERDLGVTMPKRDVKIWIENARVFSALYHIIHSCLGLSVFQTLHQFDFG